MHRWFPIKVVFIGLGGAIVVLFVYLLLTPHLIGPRERPPRWRCQLNLHCQGVALTQYSQDYDGRYPWRVGAAKPEEAWRDLGMLYLQYEYSEDCFFCPASRDRMFEFKKASQDKGNHSLGPLLSASSLEVISYAYSFDARDPQQPKPWTEEAHSTLRLMADKKAGIALEARSNHQLDGRNVLYHSGYVEWEAEPSPLDPDEEDNQVGASEAKEYRAWWSDPPFYGE